MKCRSCGSEQIEKFLSLGEQPLANNFLREKDFPNEKRYPLTLVFCKNCSLVQLSEDSFVSRETIFTTYYYASSVAVGLREHFEKLASDLTERYRLQGGDKLVVDIGSNDGVLLKPLKELGVRAIGVEPALNLAKIANDAGLYTIPEFFTEEVAKEIAGQHGRADVVVSANTFAHLGDVHGFIEGVKILLKDDGVFVIEVQYMSDMIRDLTFDNIYHEHVFYYTIASLRRLFKIHGMGIFRAERISTHGGSIRVYVSRDNREIERSVVDLLNEEKAARLSNPSIYKAFARMVLGRLGEISNLILELNAQHKTIAGYGAPAKLSTLLNSIKIKKGLSFYIQYIVEDNPLKQGLYTPGTHIPIFGPKMLEKEMPDYLIIFAWNYANDIMKKCQKYKDMGTKFIIPMPKLEVV